MLTFLEKMKHVKEFFLSGREENYHFSLLLMSWHTIADEEAGIQNRTLLFNKAELMLFFIF
jgi:hypothetical protein